MFPFIFQGQTDFIIKLYYNMLEFYKVSLTMLVQQLVEMIICSGAPPLLIMILIRNMAFVMAFFKNIGNS